MRLIGSISDKQQIERFVAYLITKNISVHVENDAHKFQIWVRDEDRVDEASRLLNEFCGDPGNSKYVSAIGTATEILSEKSRRRSQARKRLHTSANIRSSPRFRSPLVLFLTGVMIVVWLATGLGSLPFNDSMRSMLFTSIELRSHPQLTPQKDDYSLRTRLDNIFHGEAWRLITPAFIHFVRGASDIQSSGLVVAGTADRASLRNTLFCFFGLGDRARIKRLAGRHAGEIGWNRNGGH